MTEDERRVFATIVARMWADQEFADRYRTDPHAVLSEHGIDHPEGAAAPRVPDRPSGDLTLESLDAVAATNEICFPIASISSVGTLTPPLPPGWS